jgi:hypothetical protein
VRGYNNIVQSIIKDYKKKVFHIVMVMPEFELTKVFNNNYCVGF